MDSLRINADRLWSSLMELARIGATPKGGVKRLTLTDEDRHARDLFAQWAREAGLAVEVDAIVWREDADGPAFLFVGPRSSVAPSSASS